MSKKKLLGVFLLLVGGVSIPMLMSLSGVSSDRMTTAVQAAEKKTGMLPGATYNAKGQLLRPANHREWVFVGAPVTPNDMNDGKAAFPEFHNVYIDPASFSSYKQTGKFADGTVILKELVSVGAKSMDSGNGYFQGEFVSLEAMVKDSKRFKDEPGGWAFFRFGEAPNYDATGSRMKTESCNDCHSGANEDYVFTSTYPVLRGAKPKSSGK